MVLDTYIPDITGIFTTGINEVREYSTVLHSGNTYLWGWAGTSGGTIESPNSSSTNITFTDTPGTYQLQVTETTGSCEATDIQNIKVVGTPVPSITPANPNICQNSAVVYSTPRVSGNEYLWTVINGNCTGCGSYSSESDSVTVQWTSTGPGKVIVREHVIGSGDPGIYGEDSLSVVVDAAADVAVTVTAPASVCYNTAADVTVSSQADFNYQLRTGTSNIGSPLAGTGGNINLPTGMLTVNSTFNILVYNNSCTDQLNATPTITVDAPSSGGSVTGGELICKGSESGLLTLTGKTGSVTGWQSSENDGVSWTDIVSADTTYTSGELTSTTWFRAVVQNGVCPPDYSDYTIVTVDTAKSEGGAVTGGTGICGSGTSGLLTLSGQAGDVVKWQSSVNNGINWTDIDNTGTTYTSGELTQTTWFRAVVQYSFCTEDYSDYNEVTVNQPPTTAYAGEDQTNSLMCGITNIALSGNLPVNGTGQWTIIDGTGGNITDPYDNESSFSGIEGMTYVLRWTISNGACPASTDDVTVSFLPNPSVFSVTGNTGPACREADVVYSVPLTSNSTYRWTVPSGAVITSDTTGIEKNSIEVTFGSSNGSIGVTETNQYGCSGNEITLDIELRGCNIEADFSTDKTRLCAGETVIFRNLSRGDQQTTTYEWNFGDGAQPQTASGTGPYEVEYTTPGMKTISLIMHEGIADTLTRTDYLSVNENPVFSLGNDTVLCGSYLLDVPGYSAYNWSTGDITSSVLIYPGNQTISLTVTDNNGCTATDELTINECSPVVSLGDITNAFTPNGDGRHDTWIINNISLYPDAKIEVYDRWGRLVYSVDGGYENDWDGKSNGKELPTDTYFFLIDLKIPGLEPIEGTVTIIR